jgi:hypothetical protein
MILGFLKTSCLEVDMKKAFLLLAWLALSGLARAELAMGFVDANGDGINDVFCDANGDGINDRTGKLYLHQFAFVDKNKDGVNDLFVDRNGDGINDLSAYFIDFNGDGICDNVIDANGDGRNDVSGQPYNSTDKNNVFGKGLERKLMDVFVDADGDGICDGRNIRGQGRGRRARRGR